MTHVGGKLRTTGSENMAMIVTTSAMSSMIEGVFRQGRRPLHGALLNEPPHQQGGVDYVP
jgi:hypothetical protein